MTVEQAGFAWIQLFQVPMVFCFSISRFILSSKLTDSIAYPQIHRSWSSLIGSGLI